MSRRPRRNHSAAYNATCKELRNLILWLFGEAPPEFAGPPECERTSIKITDLPRKAA